jgi:hypothetical protein
MQHSLAKQGKACSAIPLPFDQFELGDMALHHSIIDPPSEASSHRVNLGIKLLKFR